MINIDLGERLSQMVDAADNESAVQGTAIARRHAADGMLVSGNFYIAEKQGLETIYHDELQKMVEHSLSVAEPRDAAKALKSAGLDMECKFVARFEAILGGSVSGNACDAKAAEILLSDFRTFARTRLLQAVGDTEKNAAGKPVRGWQGWLGRNFWKLFGAIVSVTAAYIAWQKI